MTVAFFDARREFESMRDEIEEAAVRVLRSGRYIGGPEVDAFERAAATYLGVPNAVGCASGTDALWLGLRAAGVVAGDLVLTTAFSFFATASAIFNCGAIPVFCDIVPGTCCIDVEAAAAVLEGRSAVHNRLGLQPERIKAIVPVHLYGQPADMNPIETLAGARGLRIAEDAAQAFGAEYAGAKVGTIGAVGCYSFFPTKNLGGFGDGGLVVTTDDETADHIRLLRAHGSRHRYEHEVIGTNSRLDELQAAMLRVRLARVDDALASRRRMAAAYDRLFEGTLVRPLEHTPTAVHSYNLYVARVTRDREALRAALEGVGIGTAVYYPSPLHLQPATLSLGYRRGDFPEAERACAEVLAFPIYPTLRVTEIEPIGDVVKAWAAATA